MSDLKDAISDVRFANSHAMHKCILGLAPMEPAIDELAQPKLSVFGA